MKKVVFALICVVGLTSLAQAGDLKGWTKSRKNSTGGTTYECQPDPNKICTSSQRNPNGTLTVLIRNYDAAGNMTGVTTVVFPNIDSHEPNVEAGLIFEVPTLEYGILWGKAIDQ